MSSSRFPSIYARFRQLLGRALRETGQALDRVGMRGLEHALTKRESIAGDYPCRFDDHLSRHRHLFPLLWRGKPYVSPKAAYLAPCSTLIGTVHVGANSSVWYGAVLRGDSCVNGRNWNSRESGVPWDLDKESFDLDTPESHKGGGVFVGGDSNIQDGCIITARKDHAVIGRGVTVGHLAQIHSATIGDYSLIGMASIIGEEAVVQPQAFVAAGAVVPPLTTVPSGELWVGNPARKLRDLSEKEIKHLHYQSSEYVKVARGQAHAMELGGNIMPESLLQHLMLPQEQEQRQVPKEQQQQQRPSLLYAEQNDQEEEKQQHVKTQEKESSMESRQQEATTQTNDDSEQEAGTESPHRVTRNVA